MTDLATLTSHQIRLAARPVGLPTRDNWSFTTEPVATLARRHRGQNALASLDPAMRGWMNEGKSYIPPVGIGEVMRAGGIGKVIASDNAKFAVGDVVTAGLGVQGIRKLCRAGDQARRRRQNRPARRQHRAMAQRAWHARHDRLLRPDGHRPAKEGETVVVSGAAGAVGQTVGQLAKIKGCRVVGIAGGAAKCDWVVNELGFDACIDYKAGPNAVRDGLKAHCANGVDIYFDNVGGDILDQVLARINRKARIIICGAISQYNNTTPIQGPKNYLSLLVNRARMEGMVVFDYADRYHTSLSQKWPATCVTAR